MDAFRRAATLAGEIENVGVGPCICQLWWIGGNAQLPTRNAPDAFIPGRLRGSNLECSLALAEPGCTVLKGKRLKEVRDAADVQHASPGEPADRW